MMALKKLYRRKARSGLTILGIAVCIASVVALIAVTGGFRDQTNALASAGRSDLIASQAGAADPVLSFLPPGTVDRLGGIANVAKVHPVVLSFKQLPKDPLFFYYGTTPGSPLLELIEITEGRLVFDVDDSDSAICLGRNSARQQGVTVGSEFELGSETLTVVGVFDSAIPFLSVGGLITLETAHRISGQDRVNFAFLQLADRGDEGLARTESAIEDAIEGVDAVRAASFANAFEEFDLADDFVVLLSVLAVGFGGIGVMNTMVMSVLERTREIGILQAVGWGKRMILRQVLTEGLVLSLLGGGIGIVLGVLTVEIIHSIDAFAWLAGHYTAGLFGRALAVAVGMGLLGTLYPAFRASRITPIEALRYE